MTARGLRPGEVMAHGWATYCKAEEAYNNAYDVGDYERASVDCGNVIEADRREAMAVALEEAAATLEARALEAIPEWLRVRAAAIRASEGGGE